MQYDQTQRRGIDRSREAYTHAAAFDLECSRPGRGVSIRRDASRRAGSTLIIVRRRDKSLNAKRNKNRRLTHRFAPPGPQQTAIDTEPASNVRDIGPTSRALRDERRLLLDRPPPPTHCPGDQLDPAICIRFVPVPMDGIKAGITHRTTRDVLMTRRFDKSPPLRVGGGLASNTMKHSMRERRL